MNEIELEPKDRLKKARDLLGFTQVQFAQKLAIPQTTYSGYEKRGSRLPAKLMASLTQIGLNWDWVLRGEIDQSFCHKFCVTRSQFGKAETFAERLGVPITFIQAIERCEIMPSEPFIDRVCGEFKINKYDLMSGRQPNLAALYSTGDSRTDYEVVMTNAGDLTPRQKELFALLKEDPDAEEIILNLLRGRKQSRDAIGQLKP